MTSNAAGVVYRQTYKDAWTKWQVEFFRDGGVSIRSVLHNRYLQVERGGVVVRTNKSRADTRDSWELFRLEGAGGCFVPSDPEPSTNAEGVIPPTFTGRERIFGFADVHNHQFFNLGFGGVLAFGKAFHVDGISAALPNCFQFDGSITGGQGHGGNHALDYVGLLLGQGDVPTEGWPNFTGWPKWSSVDHQQVYYKWLERAYLGGLRLVSALAVNNVVLCRLEQFATSNNLFDCRDDMPSVDRQIQAAKDLEWFIDQEHGGPGSGWYRIAYSPQQARDIIKSGKLAVVLGIEVPSVFDCFEHGGCNESLVKSRIDDYYSLGVRQIFPVHVFNNGFGGSAFNNGFINIGNAIVNGKGFDPFDCSSLGFGFKYQSISDDLRELLKGLFGKSVDELIPRASTNLADCNALGLTAVGDRLVRYMMDKKMIIDVDHLSYRARENLLTLVEQKTLFNGYRKGYPVISGHTDFLELDVTPEARHEAALTSEQVTRLRNLGGLVAPILAPKKASETVQWGTKVNCSKSSRVWAQRYLYAVEKMSGGLDPTAVALGSDFSGFTPHLGPRFGTDACHEENSAGPQSDRDRVAYPFFAHDKLGESKSGRFWKQQTGSRFFDYNEDGLAHVGLLPDFIQDLKNIGLTNADLDPLFRSAEAYIRLWERIEELDFDPPVILPLVKGTPGNSGWYVSPVTIAWTVQDPDSGIRPESKTGCGEVTLTADTRGTTLTCSATNGDRKAASQSVTIKIDQTRPAVACPSPDGQWHASDVSLACTASDPTSGLVNAADASFSLVTSVPPGTETANATTDSRTVCDVAGNCSPAGPITGNKVDKKSPVITLNSPAATTYIVNQVVRADYACADGGSGVATCAAPVPNGGNINTSVPVSATFTVNAADNVGNTASRSVDYKVTYRICLLYDSERPRPAGSVFPIHLRLCDVNNAGVGTPGVIVTAVSLVPAGGGTPVIPVQVGNPDRGLTFLAQGPNGGYLFTLNTRDLAPGSYVLNFNVSNDPLPHSAPFQLR